jgi:hypothetical protein
MSCHQDTTAPPELGIPNTRIISFNEWQLYQDPKQGYRFLYPPSWKLAPIVDPQALSAVSLQRPDLPTYPIVVRVYDDPNGQKIIERAGSKRASFGSSSVRQSMGLPDNRQNLTGYRHFGNIDATSGAAWVIYSQNGKTYELSVTYPVGFYADRDLLLTYIGLVAGFEVDG